MSGYYPDNWVRKAFMRADEKSDTIRIAVDWGSEPSTSHAPDTSGKIMTIAYGGRNQGKTWERFKAAIEAGEVTPPTAESMLRDFHAWRLRTGTSA